MEALRKGKGRREFLEEVEKELEEKREEVMYCWGEKSPDVGWDLMTEIIQKAGAKHVEVGKKDK
eukprot:6816595-Heterocapsa_arctica.AAC.1